MLLVDSSVWIDFFGRNELQASAYLAQVLGEDQPVALCGPIIQEILQGTRSAADVKKLSLRLREHALLSPGDPYRTYVNAASLYVRCRTAGLTIRSANDCLIAQIAIDHDVTLLHHDRDFLHIGHIDSKLSHLHFFKHSII